MAEMPEVEMSEEERAASEATLAWSHTPEGINRLRELWAEGKASGPAIEIDMKELREEARRRLKLAAEKAA